MEKANLNTTNVANGTRSTRKPAHLTIVNREDFKGFIKGDIVEFNGFTVEVLDSFKDPNRVNADGTGKTGCKTLFNVRINGKRYDYKDNVALRKLVGATLLPGEGQKAAASAKSPLDKIKAVADNLKKLASEYSEFMEAFAKLDEAIKAVEAAEAEAAAAAAAEAEAAARKAKLKKELTAALNTAVKNGEYEKAQKLMDRLKSL